MLVTYITDRNGRKIDRDEFKLFPFCFNRLTLTKIPFAVVSNFHIVMQVFELIGSDNCDMAHLLVGTVFNILFQRR